MAGLLRFLVKLELNCSEETLQKFFVLGLGSGFGLRLGLGLGFEFDFEFCLYYVLNATNQICLPVSQVIYNQSDWFTGIFVSETKIPVPGTVVTAYLKNC